MFRRRRRGRLGGGRPRPPGPPRRPPGGGPPTWPRPGAPGPPPRPPPKPPCGRPKPPERVPPKPPEGRPPAAGRPPVPGARPPGAAGRPEPDAWRRPPKPGGGGIGRPVADRGGLPGGGGIGLPVELTGGWRGAGAGDGRAAGSPGGRRGGAVGCWLEEREDAAVGLGPGAGAGLGCPPASPADAGVSGRSARRSITGGASVAGRRLTACRAGAAAGAAGWSEPPREPLRGASTLAAGDERADTTRPEVEGCGAAGAAGSSGEAWRLRPSWSAFRRTRSAWASSMLEEWLFTPMPSDSQRSSASLFVSPSSRASS